MKKITKKQIQEFVRGKLASSEKWATSALMLVYSNQTSDEQAVGITVEDNGVGFTGVDAEFLTSLAQQYESRGFLSPKQMTFLFKKIRKYARQVIAASDPEKLKALVRKALGTETPASEAQEPADEREASEPTAEPASFRMTAETLKEALSVHGLTPGTVFEDENRIIVISVEMLPAQGLFEEPKPALALKYDKRSGDILYKSGAE